MASDRGEKRQRHGYGERRLWWLALAVAAVVAAAGAALAFFLVWFLPRSDSLSLAASAVDVGFLQDMTTHHEQAVEMGLIAMTASEDPAIRSLAGDVVTSQQSQIGMMQGWLWQWGDPLSPAEPPMAWMGTDEATGADHSMPGMSRSESGSSLMPGMATADEMQGLRQTYGKNFDVLFMQLLLRHHEGGLPMARYAAAEAAVPVVSVLAQKIVDAQTAEVTALSAMLAGRNAAPLPAN